MIEVKNLTKAYGNFVAVKGISFKAERGQILGFLGPNGAGKTTTMRIITGFMPATSGTVEIDGLDIFTNSLEARRRIGYLPETPPLYSDMRVDGYLRFVAKLRGVRRSWVDGAVDHVVKVCGLTEMAHRICGQLSKGYRQRVGVAQALIHDPPVLVLDEPTIGLDPRQIHEIRELIRGLSGERTIVLSTHILPEVSQICDKVVIINDGRVVLEEQIAQIPAGTSLEEVFLHAIAQEGHVEGASAEETLEEVAPAAAAIRRWTINKIMRNTFTIAGKELQGYFVQPVAYVVLTVFLLLGGWFFFAMLHQFDEMVQLIQMMGQPDQLKQMNLNNRVIDPLLQDLSIVLVIVMPALTMRVFAEEKRTGTYELLLTAPVRTGEIVAGKFIAAGCFTLIMVALAWVFPLILIIFGDPEVGVMFAGYLGLALLALSFVAVGLFTSSLTQNQIVAAISSFGLLLLLYVISWQAEGSGVGASVLTYLSLPDHFATMTRGVIDTTDVVFFLSVIALALFLTQRSVESARWR